MYTVILSDVLIIIIIIIIINIIIITILNITIIINYYFFSCVSISCGFLFDRILISEALFTFPIKPFMQELIYSMISSTCRFHVKNRSTFV